MEILATCAGVNAAERAINDDFFMFSKALSEEIPLGCTDVKEIPVPSVRCSKLVLKKAGMFLWLRKHFYLEAATMPQNC